MTDRSTFGFATTTAEVLDGIDLTGKRVLVTGGTSGLGAETARAMASTGAEVIITARSKDKAADVVAAVKKDSGADVAVEEIELGSLASIRTFAKRFLAQYDTLDILINNAGIMACPQAKTEDGVELQFGTNHLGHFLLTNMLAPALTEGTPARVVSLSSNGHQISPVLFDDINFESTEYDKWAAYGQSKTANVLFTVGLDKRLASQGVRAYAVHPGAIFTALTRHLEQAELQAMADAIQSTPGVIKTPEQGAATQVYAATAPELEGTGGVYLADCVVCEINDDDPSSEPVRSYALDPELADRLWAVSEEMVGQRFAY